MCLLRSLGLSCVLVAHITQSQTVPTHKASIQHFLTRDLMDESTFATKRRGDLALSERPELAFLDDSRLVLSFDTLAPIEQTVPANVFSTLVLSTETGRTLNKLQVEASAGTSAVRPTVSGDLVMLSGKSLKLYRADLSLKAEKAIDEPICSNVIITPGDFRHLRCIYNKQRLDVSPDQKRLLLRSSEQVHPPETAPPYRWSWFDASDLSEREAWIATGGEDFHAGDKGFMVGSGRPEFVTEQTRKILCDDCWDAYFITNDLRLLSADKWLRLVDSSNSTLYETKLKDGVGQVVASRDSSYFAYLTFTGGLRALQIGAPKLHIQIHLADWKERREIASFKYDVAEREQVLTSGSQSAMAISPNGHILALLVDSSLLLFHIEDAGK